MRGAVSGEACEESTPRGNIAQQAFRPRRHYRHFVAKSLGLRWLRALPLAGVRLPDILTCADHEADAMRLSLQIALEGIRLVRKSLRMTRVSDDQVASQRALEDAQKVLKRPIRPRP